MFCEAYNQSLVDAAAGGKMLPALREHLASCNGCRTAFTEEESLFASMDAGLRAVANTEIPTTLIPRVHVALNNEPAPQKRGVVFVAWSFFGAVTTVAVIFGLLYLSPKKQPMTVESVRTPAIIIPENPLASSAVNSMPSGGVSHLAHGKPVALVASRQSDSEQMEVLVSPEEEAALLRYEALLRGKPASEMRLVAAKASDISYGIEPLGIAEVDLSDLEIPSLLKPVDGHTK